MTVTAGQPINATDYNDIRTTIMGSLGATTAGYGANIKSTTATTNMVITAAHWRDLRDDVNKCIIHQTGANMMGIVTTFGEPYASFNAWATYYGLTNEQRDLGISIANTYYSSNTNFGDFNGVTRFGLFRKPDAGGLFYWTIVCQDQFNGEFNSFDFLINFFAGVDATYVAWGGFLVNRSRTGNKTFEAGDDAGLFFVGEERPIPLPGDTIEASFVNTLATYAAQGANLSNRYTVAASQLAALTNTSVVVTSDWSTAITHTAHYGWDNELVADWHFNLGGYLVTSLGVSGDQFNQGDIDCQAFFDTINNYVSVPFTKTLWDTGGNVLTTSSVFPSGTFTAVVSYNKLSVTQLDVVVTVTPPGSYPITLDVTSTTTNFISVGAIPAQLPYTNANRKILTVTPSSYEFTVAAGQQSLPQSFTINNISGLDVTITGIELSANGARGNLAYGTDPLTQITFPLTITAGNSVAAVLFYSRPSAANSDLGDFYNSVTIASDADKGPLTIPVTVTVTAPLFDFTLSAIDYTSPYTYADWKTEFSLSDALVTLGENIATEFYLSNDPLGLVNGQPRFGLYRKPDAGGLEYWTNVCHTYYGDDYNSDAFKTDFFSSVDFGSVEQNRSLTSDKPFGFGFGYGDFSDRSGFNPNITSGLAKDTKYLITPANGSIVSYETSFSNFKFNTVPNPSLSDAYTFVNEVDGPIVAFNPMAVLSTGTYAADVTVTITALNLDLTSRVVSHTITLTLNVLAMTDGNFVQWVSALSQYNGVVGISYDRIGGDPYLTIGVGMHGDGSPDNVVSGAPFININNLGVNGDVEFGNGLALYKSLNYSQWGSFMNQYAAWPVNSDPVVPVGQEISRQYQFTAPNNGVYDWQFSIDDVGYFLIDNELIGDLRYKQNTNFTSSQTGSIFLNAGVHTVQLYMTNSSGNRGNSPDSGNPAGIAINIVNRLSTVSAWSTLDPIRSVPPYQYWGEVYRIPVPLGVAATYYTGNYMVKNSYAVQGHSAWGDYFGTPGSNSAKSIMNVTTDGFGNLQFTFNRIYTTTGDDGTTITLVGLQYASLYYTDQITRYTNLDSPDSNNQTHKLTGMTRAGVTTSLVSQPNI